MKLVNVGYDTYINMDYIVAAYKKGENFYIEILNRNDSYFHVSEEAYNIILAYGKAKIQ